MRDGSISDPAWADLTAYRDALVAGQAAAERGQGCLVGTVKVCDGDFSEAHLAPARPKAGSACRAS